MPGEAGHPSYYYIKSHITCEEQDLPKLFIPVILAQTYSPLEKTLNTTRTIKIMTFYKNIFRCIMDEIRDFLSTVLTSPPAPPVSTPASATKLSGLPHEVSDAATSNSAAARKSGSGRPRKRPLAPGSDGKPSKKSKLLGRLFESLNFINFWIM